MLSLSCSHGGKKIPGENKELLNYLHDKGKVKNCFKHKDEVWSRKNQSAYWNEVGVCHFLSGDYNKAIFCFDMSLKRAGKKSSVKALNNLGVINLHFKRYRRAHSFLVKAIQTDAHDLMANLNLAQLYMSFGRYGSADKILKRLKGRHSGNKSFQKIAKNLKKMMMEKR